MLSRQANRIEEPRSIDASCVLIAFRICENCSSCRKSVFSAEAEDEFALPLFGHHIIMKKIHIALLILGVFGIVGMSFFVKDLTTQETFSSAKDKDGKYVVVKTKLDTSVPIEYDAVKNPNLTVFYAIDAEGNRSKVVYSEAKITDMERSEGLDLNGYMRNGYFECNKIQAKCPSKYKDDPAKAKQNLSTSTGTSTQY